MRLGGGAEEERPLMIQWKLMYAADDYELQISTEEWNDALQG